MKVLIGTKNPGKIEGARQAFSKYFENVEIEGIEVKSDVPDQPIDEEILRGAKNRVKHVREYAIKNNIEANFYVASEAGITKLLGNWIDINSVVVEDVNGFQSVGISQGFPIPEKYLDDIKKYELGVVMDRLFSGNKLSNNKGGINKLTHGEVTRIEMVKNAFVMALTSHINGELWK